MNVSFIVLHRVVESAIFWFHALSTKVSKGSQQIENVPYSPNIYFKDFSASLLQRLKLN
jgi:hypothetical protein